MITRLHNLRLCLFARECFKAEQGQAGRDHEKGWGVTGRQQETLDSLYHRRLTHRLNKILSDDTHPLRPEFDSRLIDGSGRLRVPFTKATRFKHSFIPKAIQAFNQPHDRHCLYNHQQTLTLPSHLLTICTCFARLREGVCVRGGGEGGRRDYVIFVLLTA